MPLIMSLPDITICGAIEFVKTPVPQQRWDLSHSEHELWSPTSFLCWLKGLGCFRNENECLPGGPLGLSRITLTMLRIALLTGDTHHHSPTARVQHITWRHAEPCLSVAVRIVIEAVLRSAQLLMRAACEESADRVFMPESPINLMSNEPFVFPPPMRLSYPDQSGDPLYI